MRGARDAPESFFRPGSHCPAMGFSRVLFPDGRFPARHARRPRSPSRARGVRSGCVTRVAPHRPSQDPRMPLSGLRAMILIGDFPRAWVAWGIPPARSFSVRRTSLFDWLPDPSARDASRLPWEGGPTEEEESVYTTLRARAYAYMRAPASTRKRTIQK